jgi:hypothetical protein
MTSIIPEAAITPPSSHWLNRAVLVAMATAAVIITTTVLPAEYGVDPTGIGRVLGLTQMGEMKVGSKAPTGPVKGDNITETPDGGKRVQIVIGPYGLREVKAEMEAGTEMTYEWSANGAEVEFDFHGDPEVKSASGAPPSYETGTKASAKGTLKANFAGHHGWAWKNLTSKPVTITATVKGPVGKFAPIYAEGESAATFAKMASKSSTASTDDTPYYTDMPMKQFMNDVISHSAYEIWNKQGYISDEKGFRSLFPKDDEEWKSAENASLSLAEITNLLLIPGRRVDEQPWTDGVAEVRNAALKLAEIARKKDKDAYMEAGVVLNEACYACHKQYAPGVE